MWLQIVVGLVTVIGSMAMLFSPETSWNAPAAVLMGLGLGLVTPEFLMMFVKLSQHCQRGTANTTHLLAWELGVGWVLHLRVIYILRLMNRPFIGSDCYRQSCLWHSSFTYVSLF